MALTATIYNFDIELSDTDRHVYESLTLRVARHPSESEEYLVARVIAYLLEFTEGIEFSWRSVRSSRVSNVAWSSVCQSATANCTCPLARTNLPGASSDCIEKNDEGESKCRLYAAHRYAAVLFAGSLRGRCFRIASSATSSGRNPEGPFVETRLRIFAREPST